MTSGLLRSYATVYALGHAAVVDITRLPVVVEEKVDGSQFSFAVIEGELHCRSKGAVIYPEHPEGMFGLAVKAAIGRADQLHPGWIYRAEYLRSPRHNALTYGRVPRDNLMIFDIAIGEEQYLAPADKEDEARRIGLEVAPFLYSGVLEGMDQLHGFLRLESFLGKATLEGVVIKAYGMFGPDKKTLMAKFVSEEYKEVQGGIWRRDNPKTGDILASLVASYRTEARWRKAIQHLREQGRLEGSPRDIGPLLAEVQQDVRKEEEAAIKEALFKYAWPKVQRGIVAGLPEWYKELLAQQAFKGQN